MYTCFHSSAAKFEPFFFPLFSPQERISGYISVPWNICFSLLTLFHFKHPALTRTVQMYKNWRQRQHAHKDRMSVIKTQNYNDYDFSSTYWRLICHLKKVLSNLFTLYMVSWSLLNTENPSHTDTANTEQLVPFHKESESWFVYKAEQSLQQARVMPKYRPLSLCFEPIYQWSQLQWNDCEEWWPILPTPT